MPLSTALDNLVLEHFTAKTTWPFPASVFVGLSTTAPTKAGGNVNEPTSGGYARVEILGSEWDAAVDGFITTNVQKNFPTATGNWSSLVAHTHLVFYSASSGGTFLGSKQLATPRVVQTGRQVRIPAGQIDISIAESAALGTPSVPTGLTATAVSTSQINLSWNASTGGPWLISYRLYRDGTLIQTLTATTFSDTGLAQATTYTYTVQAFNIANTASAQSASAQATTQGSFVSKNIWMSAADILALPTSGSAWTNLLSVANAAAGTPNLSDQEDPVNVRVMAKALAYVRTGTASYRTDVINACTAAINTEDGATDSLAISRELGAYVVAADMVGLGAADTAFRNWLTAVRTQVFNVNPQLSTLILTHQMRPNNWGTMAGFSRLAAAIYLDLTSEIAECATIMRSWLEGPSLGWTFADWDANQSWQAIPGTSSTWRGITPQGTVRDGHNFDGIMPEEQRRNLTAGADVYDAGDPFPPAWSGNDYRFEAMQGVLAMAIVLSRQGYDVWNWGNQAIKRAWQWLYNVSGQQAAGDDRWMPYIVNYYYGAGTLPLPSGFQPGKNVGWTEWTHAESTAADADWLYRSTLPTIIRQFSFDNPTDIEGHNLTNDHGRYLRSPNFYGPQNRSGDGTLGPYSHGSYSNVFWRLNPTIKRSGANGLEIVMPDRSGPGDEGSFRLNFTDNFANQAARDAVYQGDGGEFFVQFALRVDAQYQKLYTVAGSVNQPKYCIIGQGDILNGPPFTQNDDITGGTSCSRIETVLMGDHRMGISSLNRFYGFGIYHSCGSSPYGGFHGLSFWLNGHEQPPAGGQERLQSGIAGCNYPPVDPNAPPCFVPEPDTWYTILVHIVIGKLDNSPTNRVQFFIAKDGDPYTLVADTILNFPSGYKFSTPTAGYKFGKVWLIPYLTDRLNSQVRGGDGHLYYDELIISRDFISAPGQANRSVLAEKARQLTAGNEVVFHAEGTATERGWNDATLRSTSGTGGTQSELEYTNKAIWDPCSREIHFCGQSTDPNDGKGKHIRYRDDTDLWEVLNFGSESTNPPLWYITSATARHAYQHSTIDPVRGDLYHRQYNSGFVGRWKRSTNTYVANFTQITTSNMNVATFLQFFPERHRIVYADDFIGLREYDPVAGTWATIFNSSFFTGKIGVAGNGIYCRRRHSIYIGGGNGTNVLQEYKADGTLATVASLPVSAGTSNNQGLLICEPVSQRLLIFGQDKSIWEANDDVSTWTRRTSLEGNITFWNNNESATWTMFDKVACPIAPYGVILIGVYHHTVGLKKTYLYKHSPL